MIQRIFYPARAMLLGLLTTEVLGAIHVYGANKDLYQTVTLLRDAGYLVIPNALVAPSLKAIGPALYGGLFFALSLGAGLSLLAFVAAWIWDRIFNRKSWALIALIVPWLFIIYAVNRHHVSLMVTAYFILVPMVVYIATLKMMPQEAGNHIWKRYLPVLPVLLLTIIWTSQADRYLFLDIRDFLLLSNPVGQKIDTFYYQYTLYPANVFKTLEQKTLKTCHITGGNGGPGEKRLKALLMGHDYLPVPKTVPNGFVDLEINRSEKQFAFRHKGKAVFEMSPKAFFAQQKEALRRFSKETDPYVLFRMATIVCLVVGFPILLYILVYALLHGVAGFMVERQRASLTAAFLSLAVGLALLVPLVLNRTGNMENVPLAAALQSENWQQRVAALRTIVDKQQDLSRVLKDHRFFTSGYLSERYWYAKALAKSSSPDAPDHLYHFLNDPHPNVVSMALNSLGQRRDKRAIHEILQLIGTSDHWYNQWYAYRALRALGWSQNKP